MTSEEAITYNKNLREYMKITDKKSEYRFLEENYIALDMAIKALEQQPSEDCVARSEAFDILDDFEEDIENGKFKTAYAKARERMCELPSVTPSYNSIKTDLKPCEDWKFYYKHGYTQAKRDLLCDDCISRQATIDAIYKKHIGGKDAIENAPINDLYACGLEEAVDAVENLPSVTPQQKMGRWKNSKCDKCGASRPPLFDNYCPNCGAKMEVEE